MVLDSQRNNMLTYLDLDTHDLVQSAVPSACKEIPQASVNNEIFKLPCPTAEWLAEYKLKQSTKWKQSQAEKQYLDENSNIISSQATVQAVKEKIDEANIGSLEMLATAASEVEGAVGGQGVTPDVRPKEFPMRNRPVSEEEDNTVTETKTNDPAEPLYYSSAWDDHWPMDNAFPEITDGTYECLYH